MNQLCDINSNFRSKNIIVEMKPILFAKHEQKWKEVLGRERARHGQGKNKLRTYRTFKDSFATETYVSCVLGNRQHRSLALFRCGVAPIRIETARYEGHYIPENQRFCFYCKDQVENEQHVILDCPLYNPIRRILLQHANAICDNFNILSKCEMTSFILADPGMVKYSAKALTDILQCRQTHFYK
jgi:hypothetical protein